MSRTRGRLVVLQVLVVSMLALLAVRLWQVQVVRGAEFVAPRPRRAPVTWSSPRVRGQILDSARAGRWCATGPALVVSVDRTRLNRMEGNGQAVLQRLATCSAAVPPSCASGSGRAVPGSPGPAGPARRTSRSPSTTTSPRARPCRSWSARRSSPGSPPRCRRCGTIRGSSAGRAGARLPAADHPGGAGQARGAQGGRSPGST